MGEAGSVGVVEEGAVCGAKGLPSHLRVTAPEGCDQGLVPSFLKGPGAGLRPVHSLG